PLMECGLYKAEIRLLSKEMGLPTWDKPSCACLASRFAYGDKITPKKLDMVEQAENVLHNLGFRQLRVRLHGDNLARLEVLPEDFPKLMECRVSIEEKLKRLGFAYVTLDLAGYRTGSMNEVLDGRDKNS
ncbi:MAG: TIGR00268 family protein, partial [Spirochaetia bacterium]|nr:TIGR00268 family protein [Spirochaetia bacterium]